jgi:SH3-like domain-containing protein
MGAQVKVWPDGTAMIILEQIPDWYKVRAPDGYIGYIPARYLTATAPKLMYVSADGDGVYIRSKPDMNARVRVWPDGTAMTIIEQIPDWYKVRAPDGYVGYVPARYLTAIPPKR